MDTIEQKEKDTIELRKLTKFQKKQVLSLVDRFLEENEESKKEGFPTCTKCGTAHPVLTKAGRTKGGKQMYLCHECGRRFVEDIGRPSHYPSTTSLHGGCLWRIRFRERLWIKVRIINLAYPTPQPGAGAQDNGEDEVVPGRHHAF